MQPCKNANIEEPGLHSIIRFGLSQLVGIPNDGTDSNLLHRCIRLWQANSRWPRSPVGMVASTKLLTLLMIPVDYTIFLVEMSAIQ